MTVWVVRGGDYDDYNIYGVFSSESLAKAEAKHLDKRVTYMADYHYWTEFTMNKEGESK